MILSSWRAGFLLSCGFIAFALRWCILQARGRPKACFLLCNIVSRILSCMNLVQFGIHNQMSKHTCWLLHKMTSLCLAVIFLLKPGHKLTQMTGCKATTPSGFRLPPLHGGELIAVHFRKESLPRGWGLAEDLRYHKVNVPPTRLCNPEIF